MSVAADHRALARRVRSLPEQIVRAGAPEIQKSVHAQLDRHTGGDRVLSGTTGGRRKRRTKLGTTVTVTGGLRIATATVAASPRQARGMWSWLQAGTPPHIVGQLTRSPSGGKHMYVGGEWHTGPWQVSGSPAKATFTQGASQGAAAAERAMADEWLRAVNL